MLDHNRLPIFRLFPLVETVDGLRAVTIRLFYQLILANMFHVEFVQTRKLRPNSITAMLSIRPARARPSRKVIHLDKVIDDVFVDVLVLISYLADFPASEIDYDTTDALATILLLLADKFDGLAAQVDIQQCFVFLQILDDEFLPSLELAHHRLQTLRLVQFDDHGPGDVVQ